MRAKGSGVVAACGLSLTQAPSTLLRFQTKTELFCSGYGYRLDYQPLFGKGARPPPPNSG